MLTHISLAFFSWDAGNSADPDQTPLYAVSDQELHCLLTESFIDEKEKKENTTQHPNNWKWTAPISDKQNQNQTKRATSYINDK